jgi:uncharacterized protein involved in outer membrane biogenesis
MGGYSALYAYLSRISGSRPKSQPMTPKSRRRLLRLIGIPIFSLLIIIGLAIVILFSQQQRLVGLALDQLNQQLPGEVTIGGSDISIFQSWPYVSIGLQNVKFYPNKQTNKQTIFDAERMLIGFSLPDILKGQYLVKNIVLKNGHLQLVKDTTGQLNLVEASRIKVDASAFSADTKADTSAKQMDLDIKKIVLKNMDITYLDNRTRQHISTHIDRIQASFDLDSSKIVSDLKGALLVDYTRPGDTTFFRHKHLATDIQLSYDMKAQFLQLSKGKLKLEDAVFNITGTADLLHDNTVDLKIAGDKPDFRQLFAFAPSAVAKELKHFKYDGRLSFDGSIKGKLKAGEMPGIELNFSCSNAWLHNTTANKKLDSLSFKGYYTNGAAHSLKTSELRLTGMHARPEKGVFNGNFVMRDFTDPKILMQINSDLELGFVGAFLGIPDLQRITGHINLKMDFKELVDLNLPEKAMPELTEGIQSELTVKNLTFRIPSYPYIIENLNLHAAMKDGVVKLDSMAFRLGHSDLRLAGSISDLPALFHQQEKPVQVTLSAHSNKLILKELLAFDTARSKNAKEEIYGFGVDLSLETSVDELRHPSPLPRGKFKLQNLYAAFKQYPHAFHDFGAELTINDTSLVLRNLTGNIDSSDIRFSGRVNNYQLWFEKVKKGQTQIAFDLKSQHLAMKDLLGRISSTYVPRDYQDEVGSNIWLRTKTDLRYDSVFQLANIKIANISGGLKNHLVRLDSVNGNIKIGTDNFVKLDTLKGRIGNSDFNINMRLYTGKDTVRRKKENFLRFSSNLLDMDQLTNYVMVAEQEQTEAAAPSNNTPVTPATPVTMVSATAGHADAFNIFKIPFIDFNAAIAIGELRYHQLGVQNLFTNLRMQANQHIYLDTLRMEMAGGRISAHAHFDGSDPKKIYLKSTIGAEDINIERLMLKLDNFGQDYMINNNIKGTLSGQIQSNLLVHPDLTPLIDQSEALMDLEIINGVLVNFAPMQAMSSYFTDKNLNKVRFDTLRNTLTFKNGALFIPDMNINSSLGFMEISGRQSLNMQMEYYIRVPLKMVTQVGFRKLFGKKQEEINPDQVDAIEYRDKDRRVRFMNLKITGTPDNYKVGLGKAKKP